METVKRRTSDSTRQIQGEALPPQPPLCLLFDILSEGLNNNQTASQLLLLMNSTGFENDFEEENGNAHCFEPFQRSHPHLPRSETG